MTVQVRSWILLGPSVLHACSGAHVASCRVVFWRPLITDVLWPLHQLISWWEVVARGGAFPTAPCSSSLVVRFPVNPDVFLELLILVLGSTDGDVLASTGVHLSCCFRHPTAVAVPLLQTALWIILSCLRSARWLLWLPSPRHPLPMNEEPPGWCHFFPSASTFPEETIAVIAVATTGKLQIFKELLVFV